MNLERFFESCPIIKNGARYWFVRTDGGKLFPSFIENKFIGIGHPRITLTDLNKDLSSEANQEALLSKIKNKYPESKKPGFIQNQLLKFKNEMNSGDFVVIPGVSTNRLMIGKIIDTTISLSNIEIENKRGEIEKIELKTKKVQWIKEVRRGQCDPELYQCFYSHQTIVDLTNVSEWVDILLYDLYKKNEEYHFVLNINKTANLKITDMRFIFDDILRIAGEVGAKVEIYLDPEQVQAKTNLNSPGNVRFIARGKSICIIALLITLVAGGETELDPKNYKVKMGLKSTLAEQIKILVETYDNHQDRELLREKVREMRMEPSKTLMEMMASESEIANALKIAAPPIIKEFAPLTVEQKSSDDSEKSKLKKLLTNKKET